MVVILKWCFGNYKKKRFAPLSLICLKEKTESSNEENLTVSYMVVDAVFSSTVE